MVFPQSGSPWPSTMRLYGTVPGVDAVHASSMT